MERVKGSHVFYPSANRRTEVASPNMRPAGTPQESVWSGCEGGGGRNWKEGGQEQRQEVEEEERLARRPAPAYGRSKAAAPGAALAVTEAVHLVGQA